MFIAELNYVGSLSAESDCLEGGFASVNTDVSRSAKSQITFTFANAQLLNKKFLGKCDRRRGG